METPFHKHRLHETSTVDVYYPDHPPRTERQVFVATKTSWYSLGCKCKMYDTDQKVEIHHRFIELEESEGIDWDKAKAKHPDLDRYIFKEPADFIVRVYNTEPSRQLHHHHHGPTPFREHFTPEPIWHMQTYMHPDYVHADKTA